MTKVKIIGIGLSAMDSRDRSGQELTYEAVNKALAESGISSDEIGEIYFANSYGGLLSNQESIVGQSWLRNMGFKSAALFNIDNACAAGASAMALGVRAAAQIDKPILVVGTEKMWGVAPQEIKQAIEHAIPHDERIEKKQKLPAEYSHQNLFMHLNADLAKFQMDHFGITANQLALVAVKARGCASKNPIAQYRTPVSLQEVLDSKMILPPLTRLMCAGMTDGAAAVILSSSAFAKGTQIIETRVQSGFGDTDMGKQVSSIANECYESTGIGPQDIDLVELHDAASSMVIFQLEALGFFREGESIIAIENGDTDPGGKLVYVNPSGGLIGRGHPIAATGLAQIAELHLQLSGRAGARQREDCKIGMALNIGGMVSNGFASLCVTMLRRDN
jgi:acetyl-CoA acyltransferase